MSRVIGWKKILLSCWLAVILLVSAWSPAHAGKAAKDIVFQVSTLSALLHGIYDGAMSCGELMRHGNFGIGTFDGLDGEMIVINGQVFQVKSDGKVLPVDVSTSSPFAAVTFFDSDRQVTLTNIATYEELQKQLYPLFTNRNIFYAVRIDGIFDSVKVRSVPRQSKPYQPLAEVTKNQPVFTYRNVKGSLVGFWCPDYVQGINVPGFHLHFISADRQAGGHLMECSFGEGIAQIDDSQDFRMHLPDNDDFRRVDLSKDWRTEISRVE